MFGRKTELPDPAEAFPGQWVLRHEGKDYPAEKFDGLIQWFRANQVPANSQIWNPQDKKWWRPEDIVPLVVAQVPMTTTSTLEGYRVDRYIGIECVEVVIGTGVFSEFSSGFEDLFGQRSTAFEIKLQRAKQVALQKLRLIALRQGGNAVIGIDLDYTEFSGNRIGVIANGTVVQVAKV